MFIRLVGTLIVFALPAAAAWGQSAQALAPAADQEQRIAQIEQLGGAVFVREGRVVEVNLNRAKISNLQLALGSKFAALTDPVARGNAHRRRGAGPSQATCRASVAEPLSHAGHAGWRT